MPHRMACDPIIHSTASVPPTLWPPERAGIENTGQQWNRGKPDQTVAGKNATKAQQRHHNLSDQAVAWQAGRYVGASGHSRQGMM